MKPPFVVAISGASGVIYGKRLVEVLLEKEESVVLLISKAARLVMKEELGLDTAQPQFLSSLFPPQLCDRIAYYAPDDLTAPTASGSFRTRGMVVIPCAMGFIGAVASGVSRNLLERTADVMLKENRPLILVPRDMPLSGIHLQNMLKLSRYGARIAPAAPGFYHHPKNMNDLIDFVVGKVLDLMGVDHQLFKRWKGEAYELTMDRE